MVEVSPARKERRAPAIFAVGLVLDRERSELGFATGGTLASVLVKEGDEVRRGQVLARLETSLIEPRITHAEASLARAERNADRATRLHGTGSMADSVMEDAHTELEVAQATLRMARQMRSESVLTAEDDGTVLRRLSDPGEVVAPGAPVLVIANETSGRVARVGLIDRDVVRISLGDPAEVELDALPGVRIQGRVIEIAQMPSPTTGTFEVEIAIDDQELIPRSGLVARARIVPAATSREVVVVPAHALAEAEGDRATLFVVGSDGRASRRAVRTAFLDGSDVALADGLDEGEQVVVSGLDRLDEGTRVRVAPARQARP